MKILIIANARIKGGLSGGDSIYLNLKEYWQEQGHTVFVWDMMDIDFKPFTLCYIWKIIVAVFCALKWSFHVDLVYSASDFLMDSLPAFIFKKKGMCHKWVAGFYLFAPKYKFIYHYSQKVQHFFIKYNADAVCLTNMNDAWGFPNKTLIDVKGGGVDLHLAGLDDRTKIYDCVFIGRLHPTKGIKELIDVWEKIREYKHGATLAIIGDGDLGVEYIRKRIDCEKMGITLHGYMGEERYEIYKSSKVVLYPVLYDHSSMSPVEAMACGCPMVAYNLQVWREHFQPEGTMFAETESEFAACVLSLLKSFDMDIDHYHDLSVRAYQWAKEWDWEKRTVDISQQMEDAICMKLNM